MYDGEPEAESRASTPAQAVCAKPADAEEEGETALTETSVAAAAIALGGGFRWRFAPGLPQCAHISAPSVATAAQHPLSLSSEPAAALVRRVADSKPHLASNA